MMTRRTFLSATPAALAVSTARAASAPTPYGAIPIERQLHWHELEFTGFLHFTVNTFTGKEWGYGDEDANIFNPVRFGADAIVSALAAGGMRGVILTCKHHDGFCPWPTKTTEHSVRKSLWRAGKGTWCARSPGRRGGTS
jgi:alpha-L-fucosidase